MAKSKYFILLLSPQWKTKRDKIVKRDNKSCKKCGKKKDLQVHHRYYLSGKKPWEYPDEALQTLCKSCHHKEHDLKEITEFVKKKANKSKHQPLPPKKKKIDTPFSYKEYVKGKTKINLSKAQEDANKNRDKRRSESSVYALPEYQHLKQA